MTGHFRGEVPEIFRLAVLPRFDLEGNVWLTLRANGVMQKYGPDGSPVLQRSLQQPEFREIRGAYVQATARAEAGEVLRRIRLPNVLGAKRFAADEPAHTARDSADVEIVESARPEWSDGEAWTLAGEPLFVIRATDGSQEHLLLEPVYIDVDSRGRILVADGGQAGWNSVLVFDSTGSFLFRAGREGEGPGEFGQLWWASSYRGDSIAAFDMSGDELVVFGPEGEFERQIRAPSLPTPPPPEGTYGFTNGIDGAYGDGHFLVYPPGRLNVEGGPGPAWVRHLLLRVRPDGEAWDTLGSFEVLRAYWSGSRQEQLHFAPFPVREVGPTDLYFGRGDRFEIERYDAEGRLVRIMRRAYEPEAVTDALRDRFIDWFLERASHTRAANEQRLAALERQMRSGRFAEVVPAYSALTLADEGHLWVEEFRWVGC